MNMPFDIFMLMLSLANLKSSRQIIRLFVESLCKSFSRSDFSYIENRSMVNDDDFEIISGDNSFGFIRITHNEPIPQVHQALIHNAIQMLGIILQNLELSKRLKEERDTLEEIARGRLSELEQTITELKQARKASVNLIEDLSEEIKRRTGIEASLRESETMYRRLAENISDVVWAVDRDLKITYVSPSIERLSGFMPDNYTSKTLVDLFTPDSLKVINSALQEELERENDPNVPKDRSRLLNLQHYKANGSVFWVALHITITRNEDGEIAGFQGVSRDISEQKGVEEALVHSHNLMRYIIEHDRSAIAVHDRDLNYIYVSQRYLDVYNVKEGDIVGKHHYEVFPDLPKKWRDVHQRVLKGEVISKEEDPYPRADGTIDWTRWECRPWYQADGSVGGVIVYTEIITERKQMVDAIVESEQKYRALIEQSSEMHYLHDLEGNIVEVNSEACRQMGYTKEELEGMSVLDLHPAEIDSNAIVQHWKQWPIGGEPSKIETYHLKRDGSFIPVDVSSRKILFSGKEYILALVRDAGQRKREELLTKARLNLTEYAQGHTVSQFLKFAIDEAERLTGSQVAFYHFIDCENDTVSLQQWSTRTDSEYCNVKKSLRKQYPLSKAGVWVDCIKEGKPIIHNDYNSLQHKKGTPDGHVAITRELVVPVTRDKRIVAALGVGNKPQPYNQTDVDVVVRLADLAWDIAERTMAQEAMRNSEKRYRLLFENMTQGFALHEIIVDENGKPIDYRFLTVNPAFERLTGLKAKNIIGRTLKETMPETEQYWIDKYGHVALTGEDTAFENYSRELKRYFDARAFSPKNGQFAVVFSDITERRIAEEAMFATEKRLIQQNDEYMALNEELTESNQRIARINQDLIVARLKAEESDNLKTAFLANMSHEIRTPMNAIIGFSEMLLRKDLPNDRREFFTNVLNSSCHQLLSVVNDVIDIAKIETGQMDVHLSSTNINNDVIRVRDIFAPQAAQRGVEVTVSLGLRNENISITTDPCKLNQILTNIVSNAVKFTDSGRVEVGYTVRGLFLEFFIKDTGIGISPENFEIIFERFRQVDSSSNRLHGGTGLGLPISKSFVEMLGGEIWVESELGKGSTFRFTIPYKPLEKDELVDQEDGESISFSGKSILIAEDEEFNVLFIKEIVEGAGAETLVANNGEDAIILYNQNQSIDLILMDIKMPKLDGLAATRAIKALNPKVPIVALTAYAMAGDKEKCLEAGCDAYLSKPVERIELIKVIASLLGVKPD